jgi:tetratricopeptide (TPR) repeat protein
MSKSNLEALIKMVEKNPKNPLGRYGLANEYYKEGQFENVIKELEKYFEIKDDEGAAYRLLAESYLNLGEKEKAINSYQKGIKAANRHGHPSMAEEFEEAIDFID